MYLEQPAFTSEPVHPHECGEHLFSFFIIHPYFGSSPRVRGTYSDRAQRLIDRRFIPTSAGNIK